MIILNCDEYLIKTNKRGYVVINTNGDYKNHSHFKKIGAAKKSIAITKNKIIPKSEYMMEACMRLSTDEAYIAKIKELYEVKNNKKKSKYKNNCRKVLGIA